MALRELAQALDVLPPRFAVDLVEGRERAQARRAVRRGLHLAVVEVGIAAVEQPAVPLPDRHAGVPDRMTGQRDQQDLGVATRQHAHALEAEPLLAAGLVRHPVRPMRPVRGHVAQALPPSGIQRGLELAAEQVDLGSGKSGRPPA